MKALTVQQPWAWAIVAGYKDIENRTTLWAHRGPLLIHAGKRWSDRGGHSPLIGGAWLDELAKHGWRPMSGRAKFLRAFEREGMAPGNLKVDRIGAIIGQVEVVDTHVAEPMCCDSEWAEEQYVEHGGKVRRQLTHLVLEQPVEYAHPIPAMGALGLWTPQPEVLEQLQAVAP